MIRKALQRVPRYLRPPKAAAVKQPPVERDRQPAGPKEVLVVEKQGLVAAQVVAQVVAQALVLVVEAVVGREVAVAEEEQGLAAAQALVLVVEAVVGLEVAVVQAVSKRA